MIDHIDGLWLCKHANGFCITLDDKWCIPYGSWIERSADDLLYCTSWHMWHYAITNGRLTIQDATEIDGCHMVLASDDYKKHLLMKYCIK